MKNILWNPPEPSNTPMAQFMYRGNQVDGLDMIKCIIPLLLFIGLAFTLESGRELLEYKTIQNDL